MTNHRRKKQSWNFTDNSFLGRTDYPKQPSKPSRKQWLILAFMAALAGAALGWSLKQISNEREMKEQPRVILREFPAANPIPIRETAGGISFTF